MAVITLIPGDGIGPEITKAVTDIFDAAGADLEYEVHNAGMTAYEATGELIPQSLKDSMERTRVGLKGPLTTPVGKGFRSVNVQLRRLYNLYQNVRPCKTLEGINTPFKEVDLVLFRENTEGLYAGIEEYDEETRTARAIAIVSYEGSENIIRAAFEYAVRHNRKQITMIHKANIIKKAGSLFLEAGHNVAKDYPQIELNDRIIDNMCMQLVMYPNRYDVLVTTNMFGDILSDLGAGLVGGLGLVPGANIGKDYAIFEAVHGSAPDIAGKGIANPSAMLQSGIMMLRYLKQHEVAQKIEDALFKTLKEKACCTGDLGGSSNTNEFAQHIINNL